MPVLCQSRVGPFFLWNVQMEHVTEDMVFRHLLEPLVDAGVLFKKPYPIDQPFNPLGKQEFSKQFRRVLTEQGVEGAINGDEEDVSNFLRYLERHLEWDEVQPQNVDILEMVNRGIETIKSELVRVAQERQREVDRKNIRTVAKAKGLPEDVEAQIKQFAGTRKPQRKARRKTRKSKQRI